MRVSVWCLSYCLFVSICDSFIVTRNQRLVVSRDSKKVSDDETEESGAFRRLRSIFRKGKEEAQTLDPKEKGFWKSVFQKKENLSPIQDRQRENTQRPRPSKGSSPTSSSYTSGPLVRLVKYFNNTSQNIIESEVTEIKESPFTVVQKFFRKKDLESERWITVFAKTRISPGEQVPITVEGLNLLVVASNVGVKLYCIENSCPHLGTPLETGQLTRLPIESSSSTTTDESLTNTLTSASKDTSWTEVDVTSMLSQDGCEDCIVCPLHKTAFALETGQVRGEWCPYPPVIGKVMGTVKNKNPARIFDVRTRGKNVQVKIPILGTEEQ